MSTDLTLGPVPTLWSSDGISEAYDASLDLLTRARPLAVQVHTWEPETVALRLRTLLPSAALIVGCGMDGVAKRVAKGEWNVARGVKTFVTLAQRALDAGAIAIVWNAEGGWKREPSSAEASRLRELIREALAAVAARAPALQQWHTAYDHPSFHSSYPWRAWLGPDSPVRVSLPQVYAAGSSPGEMLPHRGALPARQARALASWGDAVRRGWIRSDAPDGTPEDEHDLDWRPYYQLHHVHAADTTAAILAQPLACLWALHTRADAHGRAALLASCELWRRGFRGTDAVARYQSSVGLQPDGVIGPATARMLGLADVWPTKAPSVLAVAA